MRGKIWLDIYHRYESIASLILALPSSIHPPHPYCTTYRPQEGPSSYPSTPAGLHTYVSALAIVPVVGDALNLALGYFLVVRQARKSKIPYSLTRRMMLNLAISASIGLVPGIGDILLAAYRANLRNARLLEKFLLLRGERAAANTVQTTADEEKRAGGGGVGQVAAGGSKNGAASLSGAGGEGEKSPSVVPGSEDGGDTGQIRVLPRPARHTLEVVQRDSRFIEDVS
ncbi:hypothetical protein BC827DRAFT_493975 [Russula dissimulans]|nr:hypothetical protein BC827DRAFT_493975 [Russula dissimulans]